MSTGDLHRRRAGALAVARLQHEQLAALDGELDVLHVLVVLLELGLDLRAAPCNLGFHFGISLMGCGVRMPATTSSPCALIRNSP
jgi:hypothetical protein